MMRETVPWSGGPPLIPPLFLYGFVEVKKLLTRILCFIIAYNLGLRIRMTIF